MRAPLDRLGRLLRPAGPGPYEFAGGTAVVTGAAGGIGRALARELARRGSALVLLDRDGAGLAALSAELRGRHPGLAVDARTVDLADGAAATATAEAVRADHERITLLVNNAGVALGGEFGQVSPEEFCWLLEVNLVATVRVTSALLPALLASPGSHVVNTSSLFGLVAPAGQVAYATSKFGVRGFSEALRAELAPAGVGVTCVHPGGVATAIARDARLGSGVDPERGRAEQLGFQALLRMPPEVAAAAVLEGVRRRRARVLIGPETLAADLVARVAPASHQALLAAVTRLAVRRGRTRPHRPDRGRPGGAAAPGAVAADTGSSPARS
ncbi:SDR family NAD(P)-dependent oxidoreductase [Kineococcus sp. SYSU DK005]|uniref:SDR family NAD(P)-dependent oxidoreductase n=1 Tax=Kineococcus sp. SYSU DK005 TaxID=3383126 RepID=UPI003D7D0AC3